MLFWYTQYAYITEISLNLTLSNQYHLRTWYKCIYSFIVTLYSKAVGVILPNTL